MPSGPRVLPLTIMTTLLMMAGTVAPFVFSALGPVLVADFDLSRTQFGALTTVLFAAAFVLSPVVGHATDRTPVSLSYAVTFLVAGGVLLGVAAAPVYLVLLAVAAVGGVAQALVNPLSNRLVADHAPGRRRGLVLGIKQSGVQLGAVVAGGVLPLALLLVSWRVAVAALGVVLLAGWLLTAGWLPGSQPHTSPATALRHGGAAAVVAGLTSYAFAMGAVTAALGAYLPLYAHEAVGLSAAAAGMLVAAVGVVGVAARITVGHLTDRLADTVPLLAGMALASAGAVVLLLLAQWWSGWLVWPAVVLVGWSVAWNAAAMVATVRAGGAGGTGRASGYVLAGFFAGFIVAPVVFGWAADAWGYRVPWLAVATLAAGVTVACVVLRWWQSRHRQAKPAAAVR